MQFNFLKIAKKDLLFYIKAIILATYSLDNH